MLVDPRTNAPFYVGATRLPLSERLCGHKNEKKTKSNWSVAKKRAEKMAEISESGAAVNIELIERVTPENAAEREVFHYRRLSAMGYTLLQSDSFLNYNKYKLNDMKTGGTKKITFTVPTPLSDWIEKQPERGMGLSLSKTVQVLLKEVRSYRETGKPPKKDRLAKYVK